MYDSAVAIIELTSLVIHQKHIFRRVVSEALNMGLLDWLLGRPNVKSLRERGDVEGLIMALSHKDQGVRRRAAEALGMIKDPSSVAPLLGIAQSDPKWDVRQEAVQALRAIGGPGYIQALKIRLEEKDWYDHHVAADELESIAEKSTDPGLKAEITAALEKAERDEDRKFRKIRALKGVPSYRVTGIDRGIISWPNVCCVCLGPVEKTVKVTGFSEFLDRGRYREVTVEGVPYCKFCSKWESDAVYERESAAVRILVSWDGVTFYFKNPEYGKRFLLANQLWGART